MESYVKLLGTYSGRDKVMRTCCFAAMFVSGSTKGKLAVDMGKIARELGAARTIMRMFDDLPMLAYNLSTGFGTKEKDPVLRFLSILGNVSIQVFFPTEHIAWAADQKILNIASGRWWIAGLVCWAISLVTGILKSIRTLGMINRRRAGLVKQKKLESPDKNDSSSESFKQGMRDLNREARNEYLNIIKLGSDLMNAINWMPQGVLWAGKLSTAQAGFFGMIASVLGLRQLLAAAK